ncbi:transcriptional regulator [Clostridia bacterium]|nr:transcriptional regulator [Clostridia bacterium]
MKIENLYENPNIEIVAKKGIFRVVEYKSDLTLMRPETAMNAYFMKEQEVRKRQLLVELDGKTGLILSPGAMQWIAGDIKSVTNVKGVGDFFAKSIRGKVTGEAAINPLYKGLGTLMTEPTHRFIFLEEVSSHGGLVVADGMFLACEDTLTMEVATVKTLSGAVMGGQGIFNLRLKGAGVVAVESKIPKGEILKATLAAGDTLQIDGPLALMWDDALTMSVEKSGKSLIGSAMSGEGLVNVFRGTGSVWMAVAGGGGLARPPVI